MSEPVALRRSLGLPLLTLYGLGTTIGAGIYALTGEVARSAGMAAPLSFTLSALLVSFTAFSFAELSARFPRAAAEAVFVREAFRRPTPATIVGLLVASAACVSAATIANAFVGYLAEFVPVARVVAIPGLLVLLGALAAWGISESVATAALVTLVEIAGLVVVAVAAAAATGLEALPARAGELVPGADAAAWGGVFGGTLLAFYAYLGFEDMVNVAEEVKDVRRNMPRAIAVTLLLTTVLYAGIAVVSVAAVGPDALAASDAPLAFVFRETTGRDAGLISAIGIFALVNGALIQIIMASRVLYGLAGQPGVPASLGRVHPRTRTPLRATLLTSGLVLVLAFFFPLRPLAEATALIALSIFGVVNAALLRIKLRDPAPPDIFAVPVWVPAVGCAVCAGMLLLRALGFG